MSSSPAGLPANHPNPPPHYAHSFPRRFSFFKAATALSSLKTAKTSLSPHRLATPHSCLRSCRQASTLVVARLLRHGRGASAHTCDTVLLSVTTEYFPCRPITLPSSFTQQGYMNIPVGPTSVIAAILYALPPAYSNCSLSLIEHATAASANVTLLSS